MRIDKMSYWTPWTVWMACEGWRAALSCSRAVCSRLGKGQRTRCLMEFLYHKKSFGWRTHKDKHTAEIYCLLCTHTQPPASSLLKAHFLMCAVLLATEGCHSLLLMCGHKYVLVFLVCKCTWLLAVCLQSDFVLKQKVIYMRTCGAHSLLYGPEERGIIILLLCHAKRYSWLYWLLKWILSWWWLPLIFQQKMTEPCLMKMTALWICGD